MRVATWLAALTVISVSHMAIAQAVASDGREEPSVDDFFAHIERNIPKRGSVEAVYEHVRDGFQMACGFDFGTQAWFFCNDKPAGMVDAQGHLYRAGFDDVDLVRVEMPIRPRASGSLRDRLTFTYFLDVLRLRPAISKVERIGDGYRAALELPGGHLMPIELIPAWDRDKVRTVTVEVDGSGRLVKIAGQEGVTWSYEYDERSPPNVPVAVSVKRNPPNPINDYHLVSVRWFPEGKPELFTLDAVRALRESVIAAREKKAADAQNANPRGEQLARALSQADPASGRRWYDHAFVLLGALIALGGSFVLIKRRMA